jgi:hypothetical protein
MEIVTKPGLLNIRGRDEGCRDGLHGYRRRSRLQE